MNKKKRADPPSDLPPHPTHDFPDSPLVIHAQAAKQFRTDADALLAPFRNRVPTGVVGLERIVGEYVAIRARDDARRLAMDANPLARRMYEQLDDYAMHGGAGGVGGGGAAMRPGPGMTASATAGGGRHSMANDTAVRHSRASTAVRPILPAPTPEERERMAAAAAAAAAARAAAAGPGPGSTAAARGTRRPPPPPPVKSPHKRKGPAPPRRNPRSPGGGTLPAPPPPPPMGSLMDDAPEERGWRQYELPAELADQRIQERLAEYIVGFTGASGGYGGSKPASPTTRGGDNAVDTTGGSPNRAQAHARATAAERGVHLTDADVEELTCQLWDDEELGTFFLIRVRAIRLTGKCFVYRAVTRPVAPRRRDGWETRKVAVGGWRAWRRAGQGWCGHRGWCCPVRRAVAVGGEATGGRRRLRGSPASDDDDDGKQSIVEQFGHSGRVEEAEREGTRAEPAGPGRDGGGELTAGAQGRRPQQPAGRHRVLTRLVRGRDATAVNVIFVPKSYE